MWFNRMKGWARRNALAAQRRTRSSRNRCRVEALEGRMLLTRGPLAFSVPIEIELQGRPDSVAVADFNGDGHADVASAIGEAGVSVALGNGDSTFQEPETFGALLMPESRSVISGDVNNDGRPDLVVSHFNDNTISVLLNTSSGDALGFAPRRKVFMGETPVFVAVADLNSDGNLDVATANIAAGPGESIGIRLGNGDGTFGDLSYVIAGRNPNSLAVGDLDGDAIPDLAVTYSASSGASANQLGVLAGNGNGTFQFVEFFAVGTTPSSVALGDFDRDADLDLATTNFNSNDVSVLLNDGSGAFSTRGKGTYDVGLSPISLVTADFNGDDKLDLAVANYGSDSVSVLLGNGNGKFRPGHRKPVTLELDGTPDIKTMGVGDFNEDDRPDLAVPVIAEDATGAVNVLLNESGDRDNPGRGRGRGRAPGRHNRA